jgi:hypothetical protein
VARQAVGSHVAALVCVDAVPAVDHTQRAIGFAESTPLARSIELPEGAASSRLGVCVHFEVDGATPASRDLVKAAAGAAAGL